jgi:phage terminase large subunit
MSLNEIFQSDELLIPHSDNNLLLFSSWDEKIENICISKTLKSGATFSIWLHIFNLCLSTPRFLVFVAMKEYSTLLKTIIDDLEQVILGYKLSNSMPTISLIGKPSRPEGIRFPNGSEIKFLGLRSKKTLQKIEKETPQIFWLSNASELYDFDIWNPIHRILLSQNKQYQIILETYPKSPKHWIYKLFHSHEPEILNLHEGKDIAINDTIEKCGSMMWLDFNCHDNPIMFQFHEERKRKDVAIKLLKHIQNV